jgi:hypothetical protein
MLCWNNVIKNADVPTIKSETISQIKPDGIDNAAFKGVFVSTTSYSTPLYASLDGIIIGVQDGRATSTGKIYYTNNTGSWMLVSNMYMYSAGTAASKQYLMANGAIQEDGASFGYTSGEIHRIMIGTTAGKLYEAEAFGANGTTSNGITTCIMRLRRIA